jgi:hypothetical protein
LVMAIRKWRHYLLGHTFKVRTDQQALKYLFEQRIGTPAQQKWVSKFLGFDFTVEYKKGRENRATNTLSRKDWPEENQEAIPAAGEPEELNLTTNKEVTTIHNQAISTFQPSWTRELISSYAEDQQLQELIAQFQQGELDPEKYQFHQGLLFYKARIHLGNLKAFQQQVLQQFHSHPLAGHMGAQKTYSRLKKEFYWPGMR